MSIFDFMRKDSSSWSNIRSNVECLFLCLKQIVQITMKQMLPENRMCSKIFMMITYLLLWNISTIYANFKMNQDAILVSVHTIFEIRVWAAIRQWEWEHEHKNPKPKKHYYYHRVIWFLCSRMCARWYVLCILIFFYSFDDGTLVWLFGLLCVICSAV